MCHTCGLQKADVGISEFFILRRYFSDKLAGSVDHLGGRSAVTRRTVSDSGPFNPGFFPRPATGEFNRRHLEEIIEKTLDEATRFRSSCGFLLVAVDNLARINKSYGAGIGDEVIGAVGQRIRGLMRSKDTLGRYSDETFGLVLTDCTPDDMAIAAERVLAGVRDEPVPTDTGPVAVTVTIGGVTAPRYARSVAELLARAHETLDAAHGNCQGSYFAFRPNFAREEQRAAI
jgi:diguanylate cyclase (GGDEF)-like protein